MASVEFNCNGKMFLVCIFTGNRSVFKPYGIDNKVVIYHNPNNFKARCNHVLCSLRELLARSVTYF